MATLQANPLRALLGLPDDPNFPQNPLASLGDNQAPNLVDYFRQTESSRNPGHNTGIDARAAEQEARDREQADAENKALIEQMPDVSAEADKAQQEKLAIAGEPNRQRGIGDVNVENTKAQAQRDVATTNANAKTQVAATSARLAGSKLPNQVQVQAYNAAKTVDGMDELKHELNDPDMAPFIGTIMGRMTDTADGGITTDLAANTLANTPELQYKLGHLQSSLLATITSVARNYNQRGATKELLNEMKESFRTSRPLEQLNGTIDAHRGRMIDMANPMSRPAGTDPFGQGVLGMGAPASGGSYKSTDPNFRP